MRLLRLVVAAVANGLRHPHADSLVCFQDVAVDPFLWAVVCALLLPEAILGPPLKFVRLWRMGACVVCGLWVLVPCPEPRLSVWRSGESRLHLLSRWVPWCLVLACAVCACGVCVGGMLVLGLGVGPQFRSPLG